MNIIKLRKFKYTPNFYLTITLRSSFPSSDVNMLHRSLLILSLLCILEACKLYACFELTICKLIRNVLTFQQIFTLHCVSIFFSRKMTMSVVLLLCCLFGSSMSQDLPYMTDQDQFSNRPPTWSPERTRFKPDFSASGNLPTSGSGIWSNLDNNLIIQEA